MASQSSDSTEGNSRRTFSEFDEAADGVGAMMNMEDWCYAEDRIEQYDLHVRDFSSLETDSCALYPILFSPSKYPEYVNCSKIFSLRTYGDWWNKAPSRTREISPKDLPKVPAEDFIVLCFEDFVIPDEIAIFETYNPGAVIRIWAYTIAETWICLWEDNHFFTRPPYRDNRARRFTPPLKRLLLPTNTIRLQFNHQRLQYRTVIEAVALIGKKCKNKELLLHHYNKRQRKGSSILCIKDTTNTNDKGLKDMPFEIVLKIFTHLDLVSLFRVGKVSRFFYDVSMDPLLYSELNLKPYWNLLSPKLLSTLTKRSTKLNKLDMSWCDPIPKPLLYTEFKKFIRRRGYSLTHLRLNSHKFINASFIKTVGFVCGNLRELSLRNCPRDLTLVNCSSLGNLKNLERLDLYQTEIASDLLLSMLKNNKKLKHLNLAFFLLDMNDVAFHISQYNKQLVSLDLWMANDLSARGLIALAECHDLEEVDFGWCLNETFCSDSLKEFLTNCPKIRKLFLSAARGLTDRDLEYIANLCPNLEQLDLSDVKGISKEKYYEVLQNCKKLELMDLSYCGENVKDDEIVLWSTNFKVDIKCFHE